MMVGFFIFLLKLILLAQAATLLLKQVLPSEIKAIYYKGANNVTIQNKNSKLIYC